MCLKLAVIGALILWEEINSEKVKTNFLSDNCNPLNEEEE